MPSEVVLSCYVAAYIAEDLGTLSPSEIVGALEALISFRYEVAVKIEASYWDLLKMPQTVWVDCMPFVPSRPCLLDSVCRTPALRHS